MPRPLAASITVVPFWTSVSLPSMVTLSISLGRLPLRDAGYGRIPAGCRHHATLVLDVIAEFVAKMLDEALHGQGRGIPERADRAPAAHSAGHLQEGGERRAEPYLVVARPRHVAGDRKDLRAAVVRPPQRDECICAMVDDPGHRSEGFRVVDGGRLAVQAEARRERRLEPRQALFAFGRLEQRRFLAADVGAVAVVRVELE